jgi:DNA-directed RNA polymerase specialized sigma24 family protein
MRQITTDGLSKSMRVFTNGEQRAAQLPGSGQDVQKERFGTYFPRLFAYVYALTGDEAGARNVVSEAFARVLPRSVGPTEDDFVVALFTTARDLTRSSRGPAPTAGSLSDSEQELLAFVFDARLTRDQIRRLTDTTERSLSEELLRALRKLQAEMSFSASVSVRPV